VVLAAVVATGTVSTAAGGCIPLLDCAASGSAKVTVADSLTTVRFDQPTPTAGVSSEVSLIAAGNEFESFQIVVDAGDALDGVEVLSGEPLRGPGGAAISPRNLTIYREAPYRVRTPSDAEGAPGSWPDALIPARDYFYGERRSAFPVEIPGGEKMVAWIDVFVPPRQRSGAYRGSVLVRDSSGSIAEVPLTVRVLDFSIPSTSSLTSAFGLGWANVCKAYTGDLHCWGNLKKRWLLDSLYARAGLENRVTLSIPAATDSDEPPDSAPERRLFARYVVPLIQGEGRSLRIRGARLTSMNISWSCLETANCLPRWRRLAERYRFTDRLSLYLCDEPLDDPDLWQGCRREAARADRQGPEVPKLVTATIQEAKQFGGGSFLSQIDILSPVVNDVVGLEGTSVSGDQRPEYDAYLGAGRDGTRNSLWLYTSCRSYGCGDSSDDSPLTIGWPGYAIDEPASQARAMGWLAFEYRVSGELYYQTTALLPRAWRNQYLSGGNGDGTLFYPGTPHGAGGGPAIGGRHAIPIESIRLKRIRDGREDYEYLRILERRGQAAAATAVVSGLFGPPSVAMHSTTVDPAALNEARRQLAAMIVG
jgi:hypothetical protein